MKKIIIIIAAIGLVIGFFYAKTWWNNQQALKARQASEIIRLHGVVQEDSLTISSHVMTITESETEIIKQSDKLIELRDKYNTTLDSYIQIKARIDSLSSDRDTVKVVQDSTDTTSVGFSTSFGNGYFSVSGRINRQPLYLYQLSLRQIRDIMIEVTLEKLPGNDDYISFARTDASFLNIGSIPVKVLDRQRWIDRVFIMGNVSVGQFGAGASLFYDNFGAGYTQYIDGGAVTLHYLKNLGEIF